MRRTSSIALAAALIVGCGGDGYDVVLRVLEPDSASVALIEASVLVGCSELDAMPSMPDPPVAVQLVEIRPGDPGPSFTPIATGTYGFAARAFTSDCSLVAWTCHDVHVEAGGEGRIDLVLDQYDPGSPVCKLGTVCIDARCYETDAGTGS